MFLIHLVEGDMAVQKQMLQNLAGQKEPEEEQKSSSTRCVQRKMCKSDHESKGTYLTPPSVSDEYLRSG